MNLGPNYHDWFSVAVNFAYRLARIQEMPQTAQDDLRSEWRDFMCKVETEFPGTIEEVK